MRRDWTLSYRVTGPGILPGNELTETIGPDSGNDVKCIYQNPGIRGDRIFADHLDRQRVRPCGQAGCGEVGVLRAFRLGIRVEVLHEGPIEEYAGDPALRSTGADPADPSTVKGDGRLRTDGIGFRRGSLAVGLVPIALNPLAAVGDGRIRILVARSRRGHIESVHHDQGVLRSRVLPAR